VAEFCTHIAPVAIFVFNRPDHTQRVFASISAARPSVLLIVADGARDDRPGEAEVVAEVRRIATAVDWPCEVHLNFSDVNLGCKLRVSSGLDWVYSVVDRAIIIEDDCLPSPAFYRFCSVMLERYRLDRRVFCISGSNFSSDQRPNGHYYSNFAMMWGWASWRDRWAEYEFKPSMPSSLLWRMWWRKPLAYLVWRKIFVELVHGRLNAWDFQWMLTVWKHRAVTARPTVNLVQNIGFGAMATNTFDANNEMGRVLAWDGDDRLLDTAQSDVVADLRRDLDDERAWLVPTLRSVMRLYFPRVTGRLRRLF